MRAWRGRVAGGGEHRREAGDAPFLVGRNGDFRVEVVRGQRPARLRWAASIQPAGDDPGSTRIDA
jgi:hypothetical protein